MGLGKTVEVLACILNNPRCTSAEQSCSSTELKECTKSDEDNAYKTSQFCNGQIKQRRNFKPNSDSSKKGFSLQKGSDTVTNNLIDPASNRNVYKENNKNCRGRQGNHSLVFSEQALETCNSVTKPSLSINMPQSCVIEDSNSDGCSTRDSMKQNPDLYGSRTKYNQTISSNNLTCSSSIKTKFMDFKDDVVMCKADDKNAFCTNCGSANCVELYRGISKVFLEKNRRFEFDLKSLCMDKLRQNGITCHLNDLNMPDIIRPPEAASSEYQEVTYDSSAQTPLGNFHENLVDESESCVVSVGKESACSDISLCENSTAFTRTVPLISDGTEIQLKVKEGLIDNSEKELITNDSHDSLHSALDIQTLNNCFCINKQEGLLCDKHHEWEPSSKDLSCNQKDTHLLECVESCDIVSAKCEILSSESADQVKVNVSCICGDNRFRSLQNVMQCIKCNIYVHEDCFQHYVARKFVCPQCAVTGVSTCFSKCTVFSFAVNQGKLR